MPKLAKLAVVALTSVAFLSACDPRSEEEASTVAVEDLSPAELIERVLDAEKSINSIREDRTDISTQSAGLVEDADNAPQESREVRIQVGEDSYSKHEFVEPDCAGDPACWDLGSPFDETLTYRGKTYYRSETTWVLEPESGCSDTDETLLCVSQTLTTLTEVPGTGGFVDCPALESAEPVEFSQIYSFEFSWLSNLQRVESESDSSDLIQIRGTIDEPFWSLGLSPEIEAIYAECGIDPKEQFDLAEIPSPMRDYFPDRFKGHAEIWIDAATFYVHRLEYQLDSLNGDRLITSDSTKADYSLFNQAELPGPLPE